MTEEKTFVAKLEGVELKKKGKKQDGTEWKQYRYKIGEWTFWGFIDAEDMLQEKVKVTYVEKDNPKGEYPIKNATAIELAEGETETKAEGSYNKNPYAFFGMIFNQTCEQLRHNDKNISTSGSAEKDFDEMFEWLWSMGLKKKKEKGLE